MTTQAVHIFAWVLISATSQRATAQLAEPDLFATSESARWQGVDARPLPGGLSRSDWSGIRAAYEAGRYAMAEVDGGWRARNDGQQWTTTFDGRGSCTDPDAGSWQWGLALMSYGFGDRQQAIEGVPSVSADGGRITYQWDTRLQEWYVNDQRGLEHGYTLRERPAASGPDEDRLSITLAVRGDLRPRVSSDARGLAFHDGHGGTVLHYVGLTVQDADGRTLPAHFALADDLISMVVDERGARYPITIDPLAQQAYLKASNSAASDRFGQSVAISGNTVVVGAFGEASNATGVNGDQTNNAAPLSGAAYVFVRTGGTWTQEAYLKASNTGETDNFGYVVAIDGETIAVAAHMEKSNATGVNGDQSNNSTTGAGAVYVFVRNGGTWTQEAYVKASNTGFLDSFGSALAINGNTLVVGVPNEDSNAIGVDGDQLNDSFTSAGAVYVFVRDGGTWSQQAYLKASNTGINDNFGQSVGISGDTLVVGAYLEDSNATGVGGNEADNSAASAGAAYVFTRTGGTWTQHAYLKGSNTGAGDYFGWSVGISGETLVVGAHNEDSNATGVNGNEADESLSSAGAAYVFVRDGAAWSQQAYLKASNTGSPDSFGWMVAIDGDGIVVSARQEASGASGVDGNGADNNAFASGAAYVFTRNGSTWAQQGYLKASSSGADDQFGTSVGISNGTVVVGAPNEDSNATGVNGDATDNSITSAGAAYVFVLDNSTSTAEQVADANAFTLFPNPSRTGIVNIAIPDARALVQVDVYDASGRLVHAQRMPSLSDQGTPIDLSALEPGGYAVKVTSDGYISTARLILNR